MNLPAIESLDLAPLSPYLEAVANLTAGTVFNGTAVAMLQGQLASVGVALFFDFGVGVDPGHPSRNVVFLSQNGGESLPSAEFYADISVTAAFVDHVAVMLEFLNLSPVDARHQALMVLAIETAIVRLQKSPEQMRDPVATYNPLTLANLRTLAPALDMNTLWAAAQVCQAHAASHVPTFLCLISLLFFASFLSRPDRL